MKELLEIRKKLKEKKPKFIREDSHKKKKLRRSGWRRPRGHHSKLRLNVKGHKPVISSGYRSPNAVRYLHRTGLKAITVRNILELKNINPKIEGILIGKVGQKKKIEIIKEAQASKVTILNLKDPARFLEDVKKKLEEKKKKKEEKKEKKKEKKPEEKKKEEKEEKTEEDKKKEEKMEKEKVLIKKK